MEWIQNEKGELEEYNGTKKLDGEYTVLYLPSQKDLWIGLTCFEVY